MANTYTLIASSTVDSGGAATITFTSIPQTYTDLLVRTSTSCSFDWMLFEFNDSGGTAYDQINLRGDGSNAASTAQNNLPAAYATITGQNVTSNTFGSSDVYISNYTSANYKSMSGDGVSEANQTAAYAYLTAAVWQNSAAITKIKITNSSNNNFAQYSTFYLYGIKKD
jgi:hypothetical protein